ncbi:MAG: D-tyrosyl-tRNA(Tyr) deacylase [Clostridia bacterium]|nr:D-tyrosyl-tRNA(Tyr) deacylase [Clostridia bacterium]
MKAVIQRVSRASVSVDGKVYGSVERGYMILLGVEKEDTKKQAELLAQKTANLRIFCDQNDKMNLSLLDVDGGALVISQFTLCANTKKGNRPFFEYAMEPQGANDLYEYYCDCLQGCGVKCVQKGVFGAHMEVELVNDGPVTICLDTDTWRKD